MHSKPRITMVLCFHCAKALCTDQMRIFELFHHLYIIELDVEVLVDRFQGSTDLYVVLELDGDFVVDQCLEEAICGK